MRAHWARPRKERQSAGACDGAGKLPGQASTRHLLGEEHTASCHCNCDGCLARPEDATHTHTGDAISSVRTQSRAMALETVTEDPGTQTQLRRSQPQRELGAVGEFISGSVGLKDSERDLERLHCMEVMKCLKRCLSLRGMAQSTIEGNLHPAAREAGWEK